MAGRAILPLPLSTTWAVLASVGATVSGDDEALVVSMDLPGHRWCHAVSVLDSARVDEAPRWLARAAQEFRGVHRVRQEQSLSAVDAVSAGYSMPPPVVVLSS